MAKPASTTRRALFAAAPALALIAAAPPALAAPPVPDEWQRLAEQLGNLHPNGRAAALRAGREGFEYSDLAQITLCGEGPAADYPVILIDAKNGGYHSVTPKYVMVCEWVRPL